VRRRGILATITAIRGAELADPDASQHPRTAPSDDDAASPVPSLP